MYAKNTATDPQYFEANGLYVWHYLNEACGSCQLGPASLNAAIYTSTGETPYLSLAQATLSASITKYAHPDGSIGDPTNPDPIFYLHEIGFSCYLLRSVLPTAIKTQCLNATSKAADWLISSGNANWYANGNIVAMQVADFYYTYLVTGQQKYLTQYETELAFLTNPPQVGNNVGFGLFYTAVPTLPDGSDGAGYLAERGPGGTGFDGDYAQYQLSVLGRLYAVNHDARILRLANLLFNKLWSITDHTTFTTDARNGTRHSLMEPLWSGAVETLAWSGGRTDLLPIINDHLHKAVFPTFLGNARDNWGSPGLYRDNGVDLGQILLTPMGA